MGAILIGAWLMFAMLAPALFLHLSPPATVLACLGGLAVGWIVVGIVFIILVHLIFRP